MKKSYSPRQLVFFALLYLFVSVPSLKYFDELVALSAFPLFIYNMKYNRTVIRLNTQEKFWKYIIILLFTGIIGSIIFRYQPFLNIALPDAFTHIKFWLEIYVGMHLFRGVFQSASFAKKLYVHIRLIIFVYLVLLLVDILFGGIFKTDIRYGLRSTTLFYSHTTTFASMCVLLLAMLVAVKPYVKGTNVYFAILVVLLCSTLRSKAVGAAFLSIVLYYIVIVRRKKMNAWTFLLLAPVVVALAWEQIEFYFFSSIQSDSARYRLLIASLAVARDHFPIGSGFGTFATYFSIVRYSPLYSMYNLSNVHGLQDGASQFASDSFWPAILGQTGVIGLFAMCAAVLALFRRIQRIRFSDKYDYLSALILFSYLIILSTAESAFLHPNTLFYALWLGLLFAKNPVKQKALTS